MTDRDRLIDLLVNSPSLDTWENDFEGAADYLLANGVIVPPCKVGQIVYELYQKYSGDFIIREEKVSAIQQKADKSWKIRLTFNSNVFEITPDKIGKKVFFTKEEAEEYLKELKDDA